MLSVIFGNFKRRNQYQITDCYDLHVFLDFATPVIVEHRDVLVGAVSVIAESASYRQGMETKNCSHDMWRKK